MRLQCWKSVMFLYDIVWHSHAHTMQKQLCLCCNSLAGFVPIRFHLLNQEWMMTSLLFTIKMMSCTLVWTVHASYDYVFHANSAGAAEHLKSIKLLCGYKQWRSEESNSTFYTHPNVNVTQKLQRCLCSVAWFHTLKHVCPTLYSCMILHGS